jgi:predicted dehydrogenase
MHRVVIAGAGQIGSRHLQGLGKIDIPIRIDVIDPSPSSLQTAKQRFNEVPFNNNVKSVNFYTRFEMTGQIVDLAIIATTADVRAKVTRELCRSVTPKNILFEKVVFQSVEDFTEIADLMSKHGINAWVNCSRRAYPFYNELKKLFCDGDPITYSVQGGEWGLACNAIHFIDHVAFLIDNTDYTIAPSGLREVFEAKRQGFIEFSGILQGIFSDGTEFILHSRRHCNAPHLISIFGRSYRIIIDERAGIAQASRMEQGWTWEPLTFRVPLQSELTSVIAKAILQKEECILPKLEESFRLHAPMIECFLNHIEKVSHKKLKYCPIT